VGLAYKGIDYACSGLIEADIRWTVNDNTPPGRLPITYDTWYDRRAGRTREPYELYDSEVLTVKDTTWRTSLNPQFARGFVGTDMYDLNCWDEDGNPVVIDCHRADGKGGTANLGNWMIVYHNNYTFANTGNTPRDFTVYLHAGGHYIAVRDRDGNVLDAQLKCHPIIDTNEAKENDARYVKRGSQYWPIVEGRPYWDVFKERAEMAAVTVQPNSVEQVTLEYVILANSNGGIVHWVTVG
jgi:hypothetical protein